MLNWSVRPNCYLTPKFKQLKVPIQTGKLSELSTKLVFILSVWDAKLAGNEWGSIPVSESACLQWLAESLGYEEPVSGITPCNLAGNANSQYRVLVVSQPALVLLWVKVFNIWKASPLWGKSTDIKKHSTYQDTLAWHLSVRKVWVPFSQLCKHICSIYVCLDLFKLTTVRINCLVWGMKKKQPVNMSSPTSRSRGWRNYFYQQLPITIDGDKCFTEETDFK